MAELEHESVELPPLDFTDLTVPLEESEHMRAFARIQARSDALPANGETETVINALLQWPRGDGYAYYVVTRENPLTVKHVAFGDEWTVEPELIRGLTRRDVVEQLTRRRHLRELLG